MKQFLNIKKMKINKLIHSMLAPLRRYTGKIENLKLTIVKCSILNPDI
jgi:hypothetical protein